MKRRNWILLLCVMLTGMAFFSCQQGKMGACRIHGQVTDAALNDVQVFLVPMHNDSQYNVDSVYIKDGKFEFASDTVMLAKIVVDYHHRSGVQSLLVMVEPGDVNVVVGQVSSAMGTPMNDTLQHWKTITEQHNMEMARLGRAAKAAQADSLAAKHFRAQSDSVHLAYKKATRAMASTLPDGELKTFLTELFPLKYKKKNPDGTIVWVDSDTKEELGPVEE